MKISSAEFIRSAFENKHWLSDGRPEIAFLGRSNVGKSSLINSLLQRKGLARTSNTPGRTQSINFFLINDSFYFADLPGYGYAKVSKAMRAEWGDMAREYLEERDELRLCIQLIDARHPPTKLDLQLSEWLAHHEKPRMIVATKSDKLSNNELSRSIREIRKTIPDVLTVPYSSESSRGRDDVWKAINDAIESDRSV